MSLCANVSKISNCQRLTNVVSGGELERLRLFAGAADANALRYRAAASTNTYASTRNKTKLSAGQFNGCLRITFLGALLCVYRSHVSHLKKITDQLVRNCSMRTLWGGKPLPPTDSQGKLSFDPMFPCLTVKEAP